MSIGAAFVLLFSESLRSQESGDLQAMVLCFCLRCMPRHHRYYGFMPCMYTESKELHVRLQIITNTCRLPPRFVWERHLPS